MAISHSAANATLATAEARRPTVVMLTPDRQIDRRILRQADALEAAGWDVTIIGMPVDPGTHEIDRRVVRVGTQARTPTRESLVLSGYRWIRGVLPMNGAAMNALKALAWRYITDQEEFYLRMFWEKVRQYPADVFMAHDLPVLAVAHAAAEAIGAKLVYDSHELYSEQQFPDSQKRRWAEIEARHIGACDLTITINPSIAAELRKRYNLDQVEVIYSAEEFDESLQRSTKLRKAIGVDAETPVLLFQGGFSAGRSLETLVAAMSQVRNRRIHLVLLGDGVLRQSLSRRVRKLRLTDRVHILQAVPQNDLPEWTVGADAGIIPYQANCLNNYYCTPNKLFEFIAAGLPILGSDLPEIRRIVAGNDIGVVTKLDDVSTMAAAIDEFFGDSARLQRWRLRLQEVRRTLSWKQESSKLVTAFAGLRR